MLVALLRNNKR